MTTDQKRHVQQHGATGAEGAFATLAMTTLEAMDAIEHAERLIARGKSLEDLLERSKFKRQHRHCPKDFTKDQVRLVRQIVLAQTSSIRRAPGPSQGCLL